MSKKKILKKSIFIVCEGQTEERYFNAIGDVINEDSDFSVKATVLEIVDGTKQDPLNLVKEAKARKDDEGYDEAWAVFDKDREVNIDIRKEAFEYAIENGIKIAFSSISFEHWVILHFEKNKKKFERCDCNSRGDSPCVCEGEVCLLSALLKLYPSYKKGSYKLYERLSDKTDNAIENSAWLKFQMRGEIITSPIYELNPYTDVEELVVMLLERKNILFSQINHEVEIEKLNLKVISYLNKTVKIRIKNNKPISIALNNANEFYITDEIGNRYAYHMANTATLIPEQVSDVDLVFTIPDGIIGSLFLNYKEKNTRVIILLN